MARRRTTTSLSPPFLKRVSAAFPPDADMGRFPLNLGFLKHGDLDIEFRKNVTIIVGDNGSGKSSLLEAIASNCGFSLIGGSKSHINYTRETSLLAPYLRFAWLPKMTSGFFVRAETIFSFIEAIDNIAEESGEDIYEAYGGRSLKQRSHGEVFLSLFEKRFGQPGVYIIDEPEAALSPQRQLDFLRLIAKLDKGNQSQIIMATHSILLMAYPGAQLIRIMPTGIQETGFKDMPHFKILQEFTKNPDIFINKVLEDAE